MLSRRSLLAATAMIPVLARAGATVPRGDLIPVRGTRLYVEACGPEGATPIVYVHGGPGAGSLDASLYQAARIGAGTRLISYDQRGVLRSDAAQSVTLEDQIEDLEALRQALGVRRWVLWGHSYGGVFATRYAMRYPRQTAGLIYENCTFDPTGTLRQMIGACADFLEQKGDAVGAAAARTKAQAPLSARELTDAYVAISQKFGAERDHLYVHQPEFFGFYSRMIEGSKLGELWQRCETHYELLTKDAELFRDLRPSLGEIKAPALMISGRHDHVTTPDQVEMFLRGPARQREVFENSSHFVHVEEADGFARSVLRFVRSLEA